MPQYNFEILRYLRKQHKMTIDDLAKKSAISFAVISKLERNQTNPSLGTLQAIAGALDISSTELVSMAEIKTQEIRKEEAYDSDGFHFKRFRYSNVTILSVLAKKGSKVSKPEIHQDDNEIVMVKQGKIKLSSAMGDFVLKSGESMQFDAVFSHTYEVIRDCELIILHIKKEKRF